MWLDKREAALSSSRPGPPAWPTRSVGCWLICRLDGDQMSDFISMLFSGVMTEKSRDLYLSVCAALGLLLFPIHSHHRRWIQFNNESEHSLFPLEAADKSHFLLGRAQSCCVFKPQSRRGKVRFGSKTLQIVWIVNVTVVRLRIYIRKPDQSALDMVLGWKFKVNGLRLRFNTVHYSVWAN